MKTFRYRGWRLIAERDRVVIERDNARRGPLFAIGPNAQLAGRIRDARLASGLTQQQFAERVGCSMKSVQNWEAGSSTPRHGSVRAVASITKRPLTFFYGDEVEAPYRSPFESNGEAA